MSLGFSFARYWVAVFVVASVSACGYDDGPDDFAEVETHTSELNEIDSQSFDSLGLGCELRVDGGVVHVEIANSSSDPVQLFAWDSPWDQVGNPFQIRESGTVNDAPYIGPIVNRGVPTELAYMTIPPSGSLTADYVLGGQYAVPVADHVLSVRADIFDGISHNCPSATIPSEDIPHFALSPFGLDPHPNCSRETQEKMQRIINESMRIVRLARTEVRHGPQSAMYRRWFGDEYFQDDRFVWVNAALRAFENMLDEDEYVRCGTRGDACDGNLGAVTDYIFDVQLFLCPALWDAEFIAPRRPSQVQTLIHELAHLVDHYAPVVDKKHRVCSDFPGSYCYRYERALRLAPHCPRCAQTNADNYAFFALDVFYWPAVISAAVL